MAFNLFITNGNMKSGVCMSIKPPNKSIFWRSTSLKVNYIGHKLIVGLLPQLILGLNFDFAISYMNALI